MKTLLNPSVLAVLCSGLLGHEASAQLFANLEALSDRIKVGNPRAEEGAYFNENPKGLVAGDLDGDGRADWAVSRLDGKLVIGWGLGNGTFATPQEVPSPAGAYRELIAADLNGDGKMDLAAADPFLAKVYFFFNQGQRQWEQPEPLATWAGARNLAAGDFDGDGVMDLAVAGSDQDPNFNWLRPWELPTKGRPQPATGVRQYRGLGGGKFLAIQDVAKLATVSGPTAQYVPNPFPRPVYTLRVWRPKGEPKDWLVATHALAQSIWFLQAGVDGKLTVRAEWATDVNGVRSLAVGPVLHSMVSGEVNLVTASRDTGVVSIFSLPADGALVAQEARKPAVKLDVPGGPRALELADVNADGWNEVIVANRYFDRVVTFKNEAGKLSRASEAITGRSPREMAAADFDGDQRMDFIVLNRDSASVSVLLASPPGTPRTGFRALDQTYPVDGDVAQVGLKDLNGDKRDDVLQLHRASSEASVRLAGPGGRLGEPVFYSMGPNPASISLGDLNRDGKLDLVAANMGDNLGGRVTARMGDGLGGFGKPEEFFPPADPPQNLAPTGGGFGDGRDASLPPGTPQANQYGRLYAVLLTDLDSDGITDIAAGYYDCRIVFFRGDGTGKFTPTEGFSDHELFFMTGYEARFIVAGDFDKDGDNDLALAAWPGDVVVLENTGNFFFKDRTREPYKRHFFPRFDNQMAKARDILVEDVNQDGDLDLIVGTGAGAQILVGQAGIQFERKLYTQPGQPGQPNLPTIPTVPMMSFPIAAMTEGDLDGDGDNDLAAICESDGCLNILTRDIDGSYAPALKVDAPKTSYLATGDVDGDGKTDLVGTGSVLWVALSSRRAEVALPLLGSADRQPVAQVVINEILANNDSVPVPMPDGPADAVYGSVDAIELFNGSATAQSLDGWSIRVVAPDETDTFALPKGKILPPGGRQLVIFGRNTARSPWVAGFRLPKEGAEVTLSSGEGEVDKVAYPTLASDQSYARFGDALTTFRINQLPDPGRPNLENGAVEPIASLRGISLQAVREGKPLRFYAKAKDDIGLTGLIIHYRERGKNRQTFDRVLLYDDGMNGDGARLDGVFSGVMENGPKAGVEIEFYLEAEDLSGSQTFLPGAPDGAEESGGGDFYSLTMPAEAGTLSALEISEAVVFNVNGLANEKGKREDWIELRNITDQPLSLDGLELAEGLFDGSPRMVFPDGLVIPAGGYVLVFCDDKATAGNVLHAPFKLSAEGEDVYLLARGKSGAQRMLDFIQVPSAGMDLAAAKLGAGGQVYFLPPTPGAPNIAANTLRLLWDSSSPTPTARLAYSTTVGKMPVIEASTNLTPGSWQPLALPVGDGLEGVLTVPPGQAAFFRMRP